MAVCSMDASLDATDTRLQGALLLRNDNRIDSLQPSGFNGSLVLTKNVPERSYTHYIS